MNIERYTGMFAIAAGGATLALMCMPDTQANAGLISEITEQFRNSAILNSLGGIAAIASGSYLFTRAD